MRSFLQNALVPSTPILLTPSKESLYCIGVFAFSSHNFSWLDCIRAIRTNKHANIKALVEKRDLFFNFPQMRPHACYLDGIESLLLVA